MAVVFEGACDRLRVGSPEIHQSLVPNLSRLSHYLEIFHSLTAATTPCLYLCFSLPSFCLWCILKIPTSCRALPTLFSNHQASVDPPCPFPPQFTASTTRAIHSESLSPLCLILCCWNSNIDSALIDTTRHYLEGRICGAA